MRSFSRLAPFLLTLATAASLTILPAAAPASPQRRPKLPLPQRLDGTLELRRDLAGELRATRRGKVPPTGGAEAPPSGTRKLVAQVSLVEVTCNVLRPDGTQVRGLGQEAFRLYEDGAEQPIVHFDASLEPASLALVFDSSPSVLPDLARMKSAARALAANLGPADEVAVVAFGGETHLLLPFSRDRTLLERAIDSISIDRGQGSNIYEAVYLAARALFPGRTGRKALLLLTDGQDSGLGLSWLPASMLPQAGSGRDRLSFEDVVRALAEQGIELHAISTQPRPRAMTGPWLDAHASATLINENARELGIPHYTLYLAELVRRVGGRIYFLQEIGTLDEVYRKIAGELSAQYTIGYYPAAVTVKPGWRSLRVVLARVAQAGVAVPTIRHRLAYYVPPVP